jgi:hypothetical protein
MTMQDSPRTTPMRVVISTQSPRFVSGIGLESKALNATGRVEPVTVEGDALPAGARAQDPISGG